MANATVDDFKVTINFKRDWQKGVDRVPAEIDTDLKLLYVESRPSQFGLIVQKKNLIKGIWDTRLNNEKIIVTGSSRLDIFRQSGDSLIGRYHYHVLHPFSLGEMNQSTPSLQMPSFCHPIDCEQSSKNLDQKLINDWQ